MRLRVSDRSPFPLPRPPLPRFLRWWPPGAVTAAAAALLLLAAAPAPSPAQSIEESLRTLGRTNGRLYARPITSGLGAAMNASWQGPARPLEPFHVSFGLRVMGAFVPEAHERFPAVLPCTGRVAGDPQGLMLDGEAFDCPFTVQELDRTYTSAADLYGQRAAHSTPSAAGAGEGAVAEPTGQLRQDILTAGLDPDRFNLVFPDGFDLPAVPFAVPQASLGLPAGTEVTVRYLPEIEINEDVGSIRAFGVGARHSLSQWIPGPTPVDVAVSGAVQSFDVGTYVSATSRTVDLTVSRSLSVLTVFAGAGLESSDVDVAYTVENANLPEGGTRVRFSADGDNTSHFSVGLTFDLLALHLTTAYSVSEYDVLSASAGLAF